MISQGKRSLIVRMHNRGHDAAAIASHCNLLSREVAEFLETRPGYPGKISCDRLNYAVNRPTKSSRVPSLPKLKCLEDV